MGYIKLLINLIDRTNELVGKMAMWLIVPLTGIVFVEVVRRYAFNSPTIWSFEATSFLCGALFMLVAGFVALRDKHVKVNILYSKFSPKMQAIIDIFTYSICYCSFALILITVGGKYAYKSWLSQEVSWSIWGPILYPVKMIIPVSAFFFFSQGIALILRRVVFLFEGEGV